ncbi:hypothetical protein P5673_028704 [Acropora cervicornis]|uniref:Uncharacterized protein n=1 Tax=Acropora cervicornis TaxID=6130 RepID=A0AAD9PX16_ACRCE|nr:hypothetical protein P5673_028704 [Acropora cervicornis]
MKAPPLTENLRDYNKINIKFVEIVKRPFSIVIVEISSFSHGLETFAVDNGWARFIVLLLGYPHLLEGGEGSQDGASNPHRVFTLRWGNDLDFHGGRCEGRDLFLHSVSDSRVHGRTTGQHCVGIEIFTDVHITLHDGVIAGFVNAGCFHSKERWLEQGLGSTESLVANGDDLSVGKFVALFQAGA